MEDRIGDVQRAPKLLSAVGGWLLFIAFFMLFAIVSQNLAPSNCESPLDGLYKAGPNQSAC